MAANSYGFDFLRVEHNLGGDDYAIFDGSADDDGLDGVAAATFTTTNNIPSSSSGEVDASHKSNLEKQADVLVFLR